MKFGEHLYYHAVPEWRTQYIDYNLLKSILYKLKDEIQSFSESHPTTDHPSQEIRFKFHYEKKFFRVLHNNVDKIEQFYEEKFDRLVRKFYILQEQTILTHHLKRKDTFILFPKLGQQDVSPLSTSTPSGSKFQKQMKKSRRKLIKAFQELYRASSMLSSFGELNFKGFEKILKKHDKITSWDTKTYFLNQLKEKTTFHDPSNVVEIQNTIQRLVTKAFDFDSRTAGNLLRVPPEQLSHSESFSLGFFFSLILTLIVSLQLQLNLYPIDQRPPPPTSLPGFKHPYLVQWGEVYFCYRALGLPIIMLWMWALNLYVWRKFRINYPLIFNFNLRKHTSFVTLFVFASFFTVLWLLSANLYVFQSYNHPQSNPHLQPLYLLLLMLTCFTIFQFRNDFWLAKSLANIFLQAWSPFKAVNFRDFFLTDQLTSMAIMIVDIEFAFCYYLGDAWTGESVCVDSINPYLQPLLSMLPFFWRFSQCIGRYRGTSEKKHLINAGKYFTGLLVGTFNFIRLRIDGHQVVFGFWIFLSICATLYSYSWDLKMDWSLLQFSDQDSSPLDPDLVRKGATLELYFQESKESVPTGLRPVLLYRPFFVYYFAIISNLVFRFGWVVTLSPGSLGLTNAGETIITAAATTEIYRRAQWNIFRVENEQVNNVGKFRAELEVSLPLEFIPDSDTEYDHERSAESTDISSNYHRGLQFLYSRKNLTSSSTATVRINPKVLDQLVHPNSNSDQSRNVSNLDAMYPSDSISQIDVELGKLPSVHFISGIDAEDSSLNPIESDTSSSTNSTPSSSLGLPSHPSSVNFTENSVLDPLP